MWRKDKSPYEQIEEIQKKFLKEVFENQKKKKTPIKTITKIFIVSVAVIVISLSIYKVGWIHINSLKDFIVSQTKKIKKEAEKRKTEEKKVVTEPTVTSRESKPQNICIIKVPFDQDISTISSKKGIKEAKIEFLTKKERKIMFYIGDFVSSHDAVFVSARLNDKGIQHIVKNVGNKWRVYLFLDSPSLEFYKKKENITRKDLDDIEKFASSKVGEVVKAEIVDEETLENIITFIFLSQKDCEEFFSSLMKLGKKAEKEIKINI